MNSYVRAGELSISHEYYGQHNTDVFGFKVCSSSLQLAKRLGLFVDIQKHTIALYRTPDSAEKIKLQLKEAHAIETKTNSLVFFITAKEDGVYRTSADLPELHKSCWFLSSELSGKNTKNSLQASTLLSKAAITPIHKLPEHIQQSVMRSRQIILGVIEIGLAALLPSKEPVHFALQVAAYECKWKYTVEAKNESKVTVVDPLKRIKFAPLEDEQHYGKRFFSCVSNKPIKLHHIHTNNFSLQAVKSGKSELLVSQLPVASPNNLRHVHINGEQTVVSEIFVYY